MTDLTDHDRRNEEQLRILRAELLSPEVERSEQRAALTDLRTSVLEWAVRWKASLSTEAIHELEDIVLGEATDAQN